MGHNASRRGAANLGMPLMIVAFIVIGGFFYWLFLQSEAERELELQEAARIAAEQAERDAMGSILNASDVQTDPSPFVGRIVSLEDVPVAGALGTQGAWLEMPNQNPFLLSFSEGVKAEGTTVSAGQTVTVTGVIHAMSDSVATAWVDAGSISDGDRLAAEFATHFMEATRVRVTGMVQQTDTAGAN